MIPAGYLAKRIFKKPDWLSAQQVTEIHSVSGCVSEAFADYVDFWKHNGFWLFDSPEIIKDIAHAHSVDLAGTTLFYYEVYESEFDGTAWRPYGPDPSFITNVLVPIDKHLEGFDVVTFGTKTYPSARLYPAIISRTKFRQILIAYLIHLMMQRSTWRRGASTTASPGRIEFSQCFQSSPGKSRYRTSAFWLESTCPVTALIRS